MVVASGFDDYMGNFPNPQNWSGDVPPANAPDLVHVNFDAHTSIALICLGLALAAIVIGWIADMLIEDIKKGKKNGRP
jgi:hypothetical protein